MVEIAAPDLTLLRLMRAESRPLTTPELVQRLDVTRPTVQWRLGRLREMGYVASMGPRPFRWDLTTKGVELIAGPKAAGQWVSRWHLAMPKEVEA